VGDVAAAAGGVLRFASLFLLAFGLGQQGLLLLAYPLGLLFRLLAAQFGAALLGERVAESFL
jgi:hypothetical protein